MTATVWLSLLTMCGSVGADAPEPKDHYQIALVAALHRFVQEKELDHLKAILDKHPKLVHATRARGRLGKPSWTDDYTLLHHAADLGWEEGAAYLLKAEASPGSATGMGYTPLHVAAQRGHLKVVKILVKTGARLDSKTVAIPGYFGVPPSSPPGAKPRKIPTIPAMTALDLAREGKHAEVVDYLKKAIK